ncbi:DNA polymerase III subunit gamma and tau [Sanguibacter massiliensis]|uniref:DNA polymerase III subunit gamma and tau n=1 Tax=Sanguibacter massiliensis TaxID=1973217 RepID=UPI000C8401EC|nr:DNA polymerase III subunit gamma and tau [Sanguibacter massiliensis]
MSTPLYRRYRPDSFADVVGQEHVTAPLRQALRSNRVNHAYLFSGPRGCGKTTSARILARILNCHANTDATPTDTPCGTCPSCVDLATGGAGSLDVVEIDAASHGGVDDARELRERATFSPTRDRFKIFILDEAHMVTPQGFNALLKIVEEPPAYLKFIFATTEPDKVIGTIRSRTHHYPFRLVPPDVMVPLLEKLCAAEGVPVGPGVLPLVVRAGGGSVRDTLSVMDQLIAGSGPEGVDYELAVALLGYTHATLLDDAVESVASRDGAALFRVVDRVVGSGHEPRRFVEDVLERLRDLVVIAVSGDDAEAVLRDVPADQLDRMRSQAAAMGVAELSRAADLTNDALTSMSGATSPRMHLELLCARLLLPAAAGGEQSLASRLDRLERGLGPVVASGGATPDASPAAGAPAAPREEYSAPAPRGDAGRGASAARAALAAATGKGPVTAPTPAAAPASAPAAAPAAAAVASAAATPAADVASPVQPQPVYEDDAPPPWDVPSAVDEPGPVSVPEPVAEPALVVEPAPGTEPAPAADVQPHPERETEPTVVPESSTSAEPAAPEPRETDDDATRAPATAAGEDSETLRRRWDEVLATLSDLKKATWVLVKDNSRVAELTPTTLRLAFTAPGLVSAFRNGPHSALVQQAVKETLGYDVRVEGEVQGDGPAPGAPTEPSTHGSTGAPAARPQSAAVAAPATRVHATVGDAPAPPDAPAHPDAPAGHDVPAQRDEPARHDGAARPDASHRAQSQEPLTQPAPGGTTVSSGTVDSWDVVPVGTWTPDERTAAPAESSPAASEVTWDVVPVDSSLATAAPERSAPVVSAADASAPATDPWTNVVERIVAEPQQRHEPAPAARPAPSPTPAAPEGGRLTGAAAARAAALAARTHAAHPRTASADEPPHDDVPPSDEPSYEEYEDSVPFTETTLMGVPLVVQILGATVLEEIDETNA